MKNNLKLYSIPINDQHSPDWKKGKTTEI